MFDLHIHSTFSDGSDDVEELIDKVKIAGIDYFSITDHDIALSARTIFNSEELKQKIRDNGLTYVTGVEWTCGFMGYGMHILAYDFDPFAPEIIAFEKEIKAILKEKSAFRFKAVEEAGYKLSKESMDFLNSRENIRKPNIANCLFNDGYFETYQDAITFLNSIKYPRKYRLDADKVISTLSKIGAKMVWAHSIHGIGKKPISFEEVEMLASEMKKFGLAGLECYYSLYNEQEIKKLVEIANKLGLFITCGSDYHGKNKYVKLAETSVDETQTDENDIKVNEIFKNTIS